jgi:hypothetical protein
VCYYDSEHQRKESALETATAVVIMLTVIGGFIYCMVPPHWQTPLGFMIITFGWVPVLLLGMALISMPIFLVPASFILGIFLIGRSRRA